MAKVNVALVGCGYVANSHFAAWKKIPDARVVAVCDPNKKAAAKAAAMWKISKVFNSASEMSDYEEITLWDICTPINTHRDLANQGIPAQAVMTHLPTSLSDLKIEFYKR